MLLVLPQGTKGGKVTAEAGEMYPVLLTKKPHESSFGGFFSGTKVKDSIHLGQAHLALGILEIVGSRFVDGGLSLDDVKERSMDALGNNYRIIEYEKSDLESMPEILMHMNQCLDEIFVIGTDTRFVENLNLASQAGNFLQKEAVHMAHILQDIMTKDDPLTALFEPVVGFTNYDDCVRMLVTLPSEGIDSALEQTRTILHETSLKARDM